jgi:hypothetical protein
MSTKLGGNNTDAKRDTAGPQHSGPQYSNLNFLVLFVVALMVLMLSFIFSPLRTIRGPVPAGHHSQTR